MKIDHKRGHVFFKRHTHPCRMTLTSTHRRVERHSTTHATHRCHENRAISNGTRGTIVHFTSFAVGNLATALYREIPRRDFAESYPLILIHGDVYRKSSCDPSFSIIINIIRITLIK